MGGLSERDRTHTRQVEIFYECDLAIAYASRLVIGKLQAISPLIEASQSANHGKRL